jgi:hypothetical protein
MRGVAPAGAARTGTASGPPRDPQIMALAQAALACPFEYGSFDTEGPAYRAWDDNTLLLADGKGNDTLFSMYGDPDEKVRTLATTKHYLNAQYFADPDRAKALFALAAKEKTSWISSSLASFVASVDAEKVGLSTELLAFGKHPLVAFRRSLANIITRNQTPTAVKVVEILLEDPDTSVQEAAVGALSAGGFTSPWSRCASSSRSRSPGPINSRALPSGPAARARVRAWLSGRSMSWPSASPIRAR